MFPLRIFNIKMTAMCDLIRGVNVLFQAVIPLNFLPNIELGLGLTLE